MSFYNLKEKPALQDKIRETTLSIWPKALGKVIVDNPRWQQLALLFPHTQILLSNEKGDIIGIANTIPFYWSEPLDQLPDRGWDWMIERGIAGQQQGIAPNCLGGLQIGISKDFQGQGYSKIMVNKAKELALAYGLQKLIIPVRPSLKYRYPLESMEVYLNRKQNGHLIDHWLRTHVKSGGQVIRICRQSMEIKKSWEDWEQDATDKRSDQLLVEGLLNPVFRGEEIDIGVYLEPNVWVAYELNN